MDFHSVGKTPNIIDLLKMAPRELMTRSAHSRRNRTEILSSLVAVEQSVVLISNLCSVSLT